MKPVRIRSAVVAGVTTALVLGVLFQILVNDGSSLPQHSWWEAALIALVGAALVSSGWRIRAYVEALKKRIQDDGEVPSGASVGLRGESTMPSPDTARRTLVLSQAAALGGAVLAGWYLAQIGAHVQRWNATSARTAVALLGVLVLEGVSLSVAGFTVQKWCTLPDDRR